MKKCIQTIMIIMITIVFVSGCNENGPNEVKSEVDASTLNRIVDWTLTVEYPYEFEVTLENSLSLNWTGSRTQYYLPYSYNGVAAGHYLGKLKRFIGSTSYSFPSGVSQFDSNPDATVSFSEDCPSVLIGGPPWAYIGDQPTSNLSSTNTTSCSLYIQLFFVEYTIFPTYSVNIMYPEDASEIDAEITADGQIHKHDSGSYSSRDISIDLGVSGLSLNDLTLSDDNINLMAGSLEINGTILTGEMQYLK